MVLISDRYALLQTLPEVGTKGLEWRLFSDVERGKNATTGGG